MNLFQFRGVNSDSGEGVGRDEPWAGAEGALSPLIILGSGVKSRNLHGVFFFKGNLLNFYSCDKSEPNGKQRSQSLGLGLVFFNLKLIFSFLRYFLQP